MKLKRKQQQFDDDLTIIENILQQRENQNNRNNKRYVIQQAFQFIRTIALLGLAYWGYITRHTIHAFIVELFTNPKLHP